MRSASHLAIAALVAALGPTLPASPTQAADHRDGPAVLADPSTDINDVYSWMSPDGKTVYLVMTVFPDAKVTSAKFSNAAYYVFHTSSRPSFTSRLATPTEIVVSFDQSQRLQAWVGSDKANYVTGDGSLAAGLVSKNGKVRVFAGLRDDPFFFNLDGFNRAVNLVKQNLATLTFNSTDKPGCLTGPSDKIDAVVSALSRGADGNSAGTNSFKTFNTLAIVMAVDKTLLNAGGPIFSVWASTHKK